MKQIKFVTLLVIAFLQRWFRNLYLFNRQALKKSRLNYLVVVSLLPFFLWVILKFVPHLLIPQTLNIGMIGVFSQASLPPTVSSLVTQPLVTLDYSGQAVPRLVAGWTVNNDSTLYTVKLKDNLYWQDGTKLRASDLELNLSDVEIKVVDEETIEFKLPDSFSPFPTLLTGPTYKKNSLIGVGEFMINSVNLNGNIVTRLILKSKNKDLPVLVFKFYPDEKTLKSAFELGETDVLMGLSTSNDFSQVANLKRKAVAFYNRVVSIFYNTKDPSLSDKNLRNGLSYATPITESEERARGPLPQSSWVFNPNLKEQLSNEQAAKNSLAKVDDLKTKNIVLTATPALSLVGEKIVAEWNKFGVAATLRIESGIPQSFQALLIAQPIPLDPDQYALWHSTQGKTNISHYSSPRVDRDLEDARKSADKEVRKERYFDFQKVLLDDAPATFLYFPKLNILYRKKVEKNLDKILKIEFSDHSR